MRLHKFLIIDDNPDGRFLLSKTLMRKFPKAVVQECQDVDVAVALAAEKDLTLIVVHRLWDMDGACLIRELRKADPGVIIIAVSGVDRTEEALDAGATRFLRYDEWLRVGSVAGELFAMPAQSVAPFEVKNSRR